MNELAAAIAEKKRTARPTQHDDGIKREVAHRLALFLNKSDGEILIDECESELLAIFNKGDIPDDGYVLAKLLENHGWVIYADLVNLLDYVSLLTAQAAETAAQA